MLCVLGRIRWPLKCNKEPRDMVIARGKYATSLRNITLTLKDTSKADLDTTFKSVKRLAAFEVNSEVNLLQWC
jgi:gamma-glutamylcysteine synthetase